MNSQERREARYQRRRMKREENRRKIRELYNDPNDSFGLFALADAYLRVRSTSKWKLRTQTYGSEIFTNSAVLSEKIITRKWKPGKKNCFDINERGHERHIEAVPVPDKCVQNSLSKNCLVPILSHSLIDNNPASLPGKGTDYMLKHLDEDLRHHYATHGMTGKIFLFDYHDYFASIPHAKLTTNVNAMVRNDMINHTYNLMIDDCDGDTGINLGSPVSQVSAVFYPNGIDHWFTDKLGIKGYGRFMDDGYAILNNAIDEKSVIEEFKKRSKALGLEAHLSKCRVIKFGDPFKLLKIRYYITKTGKIVKRMDKKNIRRERERIRKQYNLCEKGVLPFTECRLNLYSWLCSKKRALTFHVCYNAISYFNHVFYKYGIFTIPKKKPCKGKRHQWHKVRYAARLCAA